MTAAISLLPGADGPDDVGGLEARFVRVRPSAALAPDQELAQSTAEALISEKSLPPLNDRISPTSHVDGA